jgi:hypothetical protein
MSIYNFENFIRQLHFELLNVVASLMRSVAFLFQTFDKLFEQGSYLVHGPLTFRATKSSSTQDTSNCSTLRLNYVSRHVTLLSECSSKLRAFNTLLPISSSFRFFDHTPEDHCEEMGINRDEPKGVYNRGSDQSIDSSGDCGSGCKLESTTSRQLLH